MSRINGPNPVRPRNPFLSQHFDDFVISVAEEIFAQALGRSVADVLVHNFRIREPSLGHDTAEAGLRSKIETFNKLLAESFGEFHSSIMQVVVEEVYALTGFEAQIDSANVLEALEKARAVYPERRAAGAAIS